MHSIGSGWGKGNWDRAQVVALERMRVGLALPNFHFNNLIRQMLRVNFIREARNISTLVELRDVLASGKIDLLITMPELDGLAIRGLLQEYRHGRIGEDPFLVILMLIDSPTASDISQVMEYGADAMLRLPFGSNLVEEKLRFYLKVDHRPFMVTEKFVGPDRRSQQRRNCPTIGLVQVPNPIKWQTLGEDHRETYKRMVDQANRAISLQKVRIHNRQAIKTVERLTKGYSAGEGWEQAFYEDLKELRQIAEGMTVHLDRTALSSQRPLLLAFQALLKFLDQNTRLPTPAEIKVLPNIVQGLNRKLDEHSTTVDGTVPSQATI